MKKLSLFLLSVTMMFASCADNYRDEAVAEETYTLNIKYKGAEYVVPCKMGKDGKPIFLDKEFKTLYDNVISKKENSVTYLMDENKVAYYDDIDEMMEDLGLRFIDSDSLIYENQLGKTRVASSAQAGRVTLYKDNYFKGSTRDFLTYYTKFYSHISLRDFKFNDETSSLRVYSNIPSNDSVYVNWSDVEVKFNDVPHVETPTQGSTKYATNDLRVVFLGYQHHYYEGKQMCIIPPNQGTYQHSRLSLVGWNDMMSSLVIRLAVKDLYTHNMN